MLARKHYLESFRGCDEHVGRGLGHPGPLLLRGVAVTHSHIDAEFSGKPQHPGKHVPVQGPQGGYIEQADLLMGIREKFVEERQHHCLGFAHASGCNEQHVPA